MVLPANPPETGDADCIEFSLQVRLPINFVSPAGAADSFEKSAQPAAAAECARQRGAAVNEGRSGLFRWCFQAINAMPATR